MTMKAIISHDGRVRFDAAHPEPRASADDVVVAVRSCALLPDDLPVPDGTGRPDETAAYRGVIGACFTGAVAGNDQSARRVTAEVRLCCGRCERCRSGLRQYCDAGGRLGTEGRGGVMSERCAIPSGALVEVPDHVDDDHVLCATFVAAALTVQRLSGLPRASYVTILGDGVMGLVMAQLLVRANPKVRVLGYEQSRMALCERWGVQHRLLSEAGRRGDQELVVECTGAADGLVTAAGLVRPRGTVIVAGGVPWSRMLPPSLVRSDVTIHCASTGSTREAIDVLARGGIDAASLIGRRLRPEEAVARLDRGAPDQGGLLDVVSFQP